MERPIIFNDAMSLAIIENRKTVTRRPVKPSSDMTARRPRLAECPFGVPGDKLWVREAWCAFTRAVSGSGSDECEYVRNPDPDRHGHLDYFYRASFKRNHGAWEGREDGQTLRLECPWRPSIHMPRWASRTVLDVLDVRVERLQDMTEEDARAEGFESRAAFIETWDAIYPAMPWSSNLWVWRIEFRRAT